MNEPARNNGTSLALDDLRQLEEKCTEFEAELKAGQQPRIEDYIRDTQEPVGSALLRELLHVELAYQTVLDQPLLDDYLRRFPEHETLVREVFQAATPVQQLISTTDDRP